jgi:hypothetical protein
VTEATTTSPAPVAKPDARKRGRAPRPAEPPQPVPPAAPAAPAAEPDLAALGLPTERAEVIAHLRGYEGVGPKSVQSLVDAFGPAGVFEALRSQPERVREVVGGARGERLLESWQHDYDRRRRAQARKASGNGSRGRRGGRGSKRATRA